MGLRIRVPHTFVLLFMLIVVAAAATWWIPAGAYDRIEKDGRTVVDPGSYHSLPAEPAGLEEIVLAYPRGLAATAAIVFYIFLIGGAFNVVTATGAEAWFVLSSANTDLMPEPAQDAEQDAAALALAKVLPGYDAHLASGRWHLRQLMPGKCGDREVDFNLLPARSVYFGQFR